MPQPTLRPANANEQQADKIVDLSLRMLDRLCERKLINRDPILVATALEVAERLVTKRG
jgi:hypothetical protein